MALAKERGMSVIVKTVTRLTLGFVLLYGVYIALNGHMAPGGGFAGGVIIALAFVHIMLAFGKEVALHRLHARTLRVAIGIAAILFLAVVMVSFSGGCVPFSVLINHVMTCPVFNARIILPLCEMVIVGSGLFAIFVALVLLTKTDRDAE